MHTSMETFIATTLLLLVCSQSAVYGFDCLEILQDSEIKYIDWPHLEGCLTEMGSENIPKATSENIWRLVKMTFDNLENIPADVYKKLGFSLTAIPTDDLRNITMERVEIVEAFGSVRRSETLPGFSDEQMKLIAQKVSNEWSGKGPTTYSEYDLMSMGQIVCHLNASDIRNIHGDAFKGAVESIGNIENCPQDRLQSFAKLSTQTDAFGAPKQWSKLDVIVIGNVLNGLPNDDIQSIDKDKLHLNRYYAQRNKNKENPRGQKRGDMGNSKAQVDTASASNDTERAPK